jgi:hypothetical protein
MIAKNRLDRHRSPVFGTKIVNVMSTKPTLARVSSVSKVKDSISISFINQF